MQKQTCEGREELQNDRAEAEQTDRASNIRQDLQNKVKLV